MTCIEPEIAVTARRPDDGGAVGGAGTQAGPVAGAAEIGTAIHLVEREFQRFATILAQLEAPACQFCRPTNADAIAKRVMATL